jgi:transposase
LVRHRQHVQGRITSVKAKVRRLLSNYNADRKNLFSKAGQEYLATVKLLSADRFIVDDLMEQLRHHQQSLRAVNRQLKEFAQEAPAAEREARAVLQSIPMVGAVTVNVVLSELSDPRRFRSQKKAVAYAGLAPGQRSSAGKSHQLGITKAGSGLLRWALVEAAWRLVGKTRRWRTIYEQLRHRRGPKRAIVAVARRLLCMMMSMLAKGERYRYAV